MCGFGNRTAMEDQAFDHVASRQMRLASDDNGARTSPSIQQAIEVQGHQPDGTTESSNPLLPKDNEHTTEATTVDVKSARRDTIEIHHTEKVTLSSRVSPGFKAKLNKAALAVIVIGIVGILAAVAFLPFLWFSGPGNPTWHWIVSRNHLHTVIVAFAEVLKQSITAQISIVVAMIAAVILETSQSPLEYAVNISLARSGSGSKTVVSMLWQQLRGRMLGLSWASPPTICIPIVSCILLLTQAITIVLVSDLRLASIPGVPSIYPTTYNFDYSNYSLHYVPYNTTYPQIINWGSAWSRKTASYPTFAEHHETPFTEDGVSDTGMTLRALLPFASEETRQNVHSYEGSALVVDARVTCQVPSLSLVTAAIPGQGSTLVLNGTVNASRPTPRLYNTTFQFVGPVGPDQHYESFYDVSVPFSCLASIDANDADSAPVDQTITQWRTSLCQLPQQDDNQSLFSGGLVSEFQRFPPFSDDNAANERSSTQNWGMAYLVLNVTTGDIDDWTAVLETNTIQSGFQPPAFQERDEWYDLVYSDGGLVLSVSLCYTSFMTADIPVRMSSTTNRTEPSSTFDMTSGEYKYRDVRRMLGQDQSATPSERGVLDLENQGTWLANATQFPAIEPFTRDFINMGWLEGAGISQGILANYTTSLWEGGTLPPSLGDSISADITLVWLFQEIITTGGSVAFGLQSLFTVLTTMTYYEQLAQFNAVGDISRTDFIVANVPAVSRGLFAVLAVTLVHLAVLGTMLMTYLKQSKYSKIGETWYAAAQLMTPAVEEFLSGATEKTDGEVMKEVRMGRAGKKRFVRLGFVPELARVGIVEVEDSDV